MGKDDTEDDTIVDMLEFLQRTGRLQEVVELLMRLSALSSDASAEEVSHSVTSYLVARVVAENEAPTAKRLYDHYRKEDNHLIFPRRSVSEAGLLESARQKFLDKEERGCLDDLMMFCERNNGTIIVKDLPIFVSQISSGSRHQDQDILEEMDDHGQVYDAVFGDAALEDTSGPDYWKRMHARMVSIEAATGQALELIDRCVADEKFLDWLENLDEQDVRPSFMLGKADRLFLEGNIRDALFFWMRAYQMDLTKTQALHSAVTFLSVVIGDYHTPREMLFRATQSNVCGEQVFQTLTDLAALEYEAEKRIAHVPQFISQHDVYLLDAEEGLKNVHIITKISKQGAKERIELERRNLERLSDEIGSVEMFGAKFHLPQQIDVYGEFPDFSVLLEHFITDAKTLKETLEDGRLDDRERLRHAERVVAYTALLQKRCSGLFHTRAFTAEDYKEAFRYKLAKLSSGSDDPALEELIDDLATNVAMRQAAFYTNASLSNFLVSSDGQTYHKIDFESDEHRCHLIDPLTVIYDPAAGLGDYQEYLLALYSYLFDNAVGGSVGGNDYFNQFISRREAGRYTSRKEADVFVNCCRILCADTQSSYLPDTTPICIYRDLTTILDRQAEIRRLDQALRTFPEEGISLTETGRGYEQNIERIKRAIISNEKEISQRRARVLEGVVRMGHVSALDALDGSGLA